MIDTFGGLATEPGAARDLAEKTIERISAAALPGAVFAPPVVSGSYTIITASEVAAGGGFGFGSGSGPVRTADAPGSDASPASGVAGGGGGGGGGGSMGRPVAAIVIGPEGVQIRPIVDTTKIALAAIGAWVSVALLLVRGARARRVKNSE